MSPIPANPATVGNEWVKNNGVRQGGRLLSTSSKSLATQFAHVIHDEIPERGLKVPTLYHQIETLYTDKKNMIKLCTDHAQ